KEEVIVQKEEEPAAQVMSLDELSGVGEKTKAALIEHGLTDVQAVAGSTLEALVEVKGIGKAKAKKLIEEAKKLLDAN
ncbi:MAG: helix-hairpin-helix domain-containing protein, partial [Thermodesulfobacteriota bacterium]